MDPTASAQKPKSAIKGKIIGATAFIVVGAIALTVGLKMGRGQPEQAAAHEEDHGNAHAVSHEGHEKHESHEAAREAHESAHEAHDSSEVEAHAESVAREGRPALIPHGDGFFHKVFGTYAQAWDSFQDKVDDVRRAESENERLRLENTHLRLQVEGIQFNCSAKDASGKTRTIEYKLDKETGSLVGRDLASIAYRVPTNLVPGQLYTLGISYFKAREDEKAAVIFSFLTGLDENDVFKTPKNFLMTAIAWYRLDNYAAADRYLDRALKANDAPENLQTLAHARLWKALVAQHVGKHTQSQFWLTELIDHHPLSVEASWVSTRGLKHPEARRGTASEE